MKVSILGLGYIGLPTATVLALRGLEVVGVDVNSETVKMVNNGEVHIVEPDLDVLVKSAAASGLLRATTEPETADVFLIAVPTPLKDDKSPDLSCVHSAVCSISSLLEKGNLVILESTSPVGTAEKMRDWLRDARPDLSFPNFGQKGEADIGIAYCPERVMPGKVVRELVENDRIIGGMSAHCTEMAHEFYSQFVSGDCHRVNCREAEMTKLVENSCRDVSIAFANELSLICDKLDVDVWEIIRLANRHPRINILQPGPGVGGHCIAVDPWFLVHSAPNQAKLIRAAREINDDKPRFVLDQVREAVKETEKSPRELTVACLGLSFKPNIDDLRESPALQIAKRISRLGFRRQFLVEPHISEIPIELDIPTVSLVSLDEALESSDIIVLLVGHLKFKAIDKMGIADKHVVDACGAWR